MEQSQKTQVTTRLSGFSDIRNKDAVDRVISNAIQNTVHTIGDIEAVEIHHKGIHNSDHEIKVKIVASHNVVYAAQDQGSDVLVVLDSALNKAKETMRKAIKK